MGKVISINKNKPEYLGLGIFYKEEPDIFFIIELSENGDYEIIEDLTHAHYYFQATLMKRVHDFILPNIKHAEGRILTFLINRTFMSGCNSVELYKPNFLASVQNEYHGVKMSRVSVNKGIDQLINKGIIAEYKHNYWVSLEGMNIWLAERKLGMIKNP